jgi:hypothetical protein
VRRAIESQPETSLCQGPRDCLHYGAKQFRYCEGSEQHTHGHRGTHACPRHQPELHSTLRPLSVCVRRCMALAGTAKK